jgi:hypothetical protein
MERWHSSVTMKSKVSMGTLGLSATSFGAVVGGAQLETGLLVEILLKFLATEHGVEALDGADGDSADVVELVRLEVLDVVEPWPSQSRSQLWRSNSRTT